MSEERPQEYVAGVIEGVTQKKPDTWQIVVKPDGSQYSKNLWTKDGELVGRLTPLIGQHRAFVCGVSDWTNAQGNPVRSLWINEIQEGDAVPPSSPPGTASPSSGPPRAPAAPGPDWDAKERRDYRSRAWAQTISALTHTIKVDEPPAEVFRRLYALQRMIYRDIVRDLDPEAHEDDDIPF